MGTSSSTGDRIGIIAMGLYATTVLSAPVYGVFFDGSMVDEPRYALSVFLTAIGGAVVVATIARPRFRAYGHRDRDASFWNEVILYAFTFVPVVIVTALVLAPVSEVVSGDSAVPVVLHHTLATIGTVALIVLRRRGRVSYPDWIQASSWGVRDYAALFGGVFLLTYTYMNPVFGPTGGPLALFSLGCASIAVLLRRNGALIPNSREPGRTPSIDG